MENNAAGDKSAVTVEIGQNAKGIIAGHINHATVYEKVTLAQLFDSYILKPFRAEQARRADEQKREDLKLRSRLLSGVKSHWIKDALETEFCDKAMIELDMCRKKI